MSYVGWKLEWFYRNKIGHVVKLVFFLTLFNGHFVWSKSELSCTGGQTKFKSEAVTRRCAVNNVFLEISQKSQKNTFARISFNKVARLRPETSLKKRFWCRCFPVNFAKFPKTPFLKEYLQWLLLSSPL